MPDVGVKLNIEANYQSAMQAVAQLGKALEAIQEKAKLVNMPAQQGGARNEDAAAQNAAAKEREAAMKQLGAAIAFAAKSTEVLAQELEKLKPALAEMGPSAEQVQQVAALSGHYKELANALSVAAVAAEKYKAADGGMKETDERIKKLLAENEALMDRLTAIQDEYQTMVRNNAEREKERVMREENTKAAQKETQATTDNDYQMKLASMSKRELVAEIQRLTKARKEAAAAGNEYNYKEYGEQLRIARQELRKLNQEQQINKIAFMQQAQMAQQMGASLRTITDGVMNFSESLENGTLNLTGMASAALSLGWAIKAGLGPLGWALAAVEGLTLAWNIYAKKRKEIEAAEEEQNKKARDLATAYSDAAEAVQRLADREVDLQKLNNLKQAYIDLNNELRTRNDLLDASLRKLSVELGMRAKDEELEKTLKKNEIMRDYWSGAIDEEERDRRLDELNVTSAKQKRKRTMEKEQAELDAAQEREQIELDRLDATADEAARLQKQKNRMLSPEEVDRRYTNFIIQDNALTSQKNKIARFEKLHKLITSPSKLGVGQRMLANYEISGLMDELGIKSIDDLASKKVILKDLQGRRDAAFESLNGINLDDIESGRYKEQYDSLIERLKTATDEAEAAKVDYEAAQAATLKQQSEFAFADAQTKQDVKIASRILTENATQRAAQRQYKNKQEERRRNEQLAKEAERQAERDAREAQREMERIQRLQNAAKIEGKYERNTKDALALASGGAYAMLSDGKLKGSEIESMLKTLRTKNNIHNENLHRLLQEIISIAISNNMITQKTYDKYKKDLKSLKLNFIDK